MSALVNLQFFLILLLAWAPEAFSQIPSWDGQNDLGFQAYEKGNYLEAEKYFLVGIGQAEQFGDSDPRLITALNNLAAIYTREGKFAAAESLYQRTLSTKIAGSGGMDVGVALLEGNLG